MYLDVQAINVHGSASTILSSPAKLVERSTPLRIPALCPYPPQYSFYPLFLNFRDRRFQNNPLCLLVAFSELPETRFLRTQWPLTFYAAVIIFPAELRICADIVCLNSCIPVAAANV